MAMAQKNMSASKVSQLSKVSRKQLGELINDETVVPNRTTLEKLATVFGESFLSTTLLIRENLPE
jgi:transcriptional regulator with XRE-family HTH domain